MKAISIQLNGTGIVPRKASQMPHTTPFHTSAKARKASPASLCE